MWKQAGLYGLALGVGTLALQLLDYQMLVRTHTRDLYVFLIASAFMALGVALGIRVTVPRRRDGGNPQAVAALGISAREMAVLEQLASGLSNKEIARALGVSPNTIKTHVARLFEKLGAVRRTDAIARARELGILN